MLPTASEIAKKMRLEAPPSPTHFVSRYERDTCSVSLANVFQPSFWLNIARCFHNQTTESVFGSI